MFEYKIEPKRSNEWLTINGLTKQLNTEGVNGWELVTADKTYFYFKRKIQKPKNRVRNS